MKRAAACILALILLFLCACTASEKNATEEPEKQEQLITPEIDELAHNQWYLFSEYNREIELFEQPEVKDGFAPINTTHIVSKVDIGIWDYLSRTHDYAETEIIVALIDSSVDIYHEDLSANIWTNSGEMPDDGIDNDQNGYIDDINGWNFITNNRSNIGCELFYRTDAIDVLLDSYESIPVDYLMLVSPEARTNDSIWRDSKYDEELFLQMFFGYNVNTLSLNQRGKLLSILEKKHLEKSEYYEELHFGFLFYNTVSSTLGYISEELIPDSLEQYLLMCDNADTINLSAWYADPASPDPVWFDSLHNGFNGGYYIKGSMFEYGREALCYKFYDVEYDETLKTILDNHFSSTHPALTKYSSAARAYNCHKYVWLPSYANMYWLDNPYQFYNNNPNYFQYIGNNSSAITGDNVLLYSGSDVMHSVDVSQGGTSLTTIRGVSKMHYYGVYGGTLSAHAAVYGCSSWAVYREV